MVLGRESNWLITEPAVWVMHMQLPHLKVKIWWTGISKEALEGTD